MWRSRKSPRRGGARTALNDISLPRRYTDLFTEIPEHRFRFDISSSEIRARDVQLAINEPHRYR